MLHQHFTTELYTLSPTLTACIGHHSHADDLFILAETGHLVLPQFMALGISGYGQKVDREEQRRKDLYLKSYTSPHTSMPSLL
jgi:hypothetical protein